MAAALEDTAFTGENGMPASAPIDAALVGAPALGNVVRLLLCNVEFGVALGTALDKAVVVARGIALDPGVRRREANDRVR